MGQLKTPCLDRVHSAILDQPKTPDSIADDLFISRETAWSMLEILRRDGRAYRKFFHNKKQNKPDYLYFAFRFPPRYAESDSSFIDSLVGDWDALDIRKIKK